MQADMWLDEKTRSHVLAFGRAQLFVFFLIFKIIQI